VVLCVSPYLYLLYTYYNIFQKVFAIYFSIYSIIDKGCEFDDGLSESERLVINHRERVGLFWFRAIGINLLGALALGVGLLVTVPWTMIAMAGLYKSLTEKEEEKEKGYSEELLALSLFPLEEGRGAAGPGKAGDEDGPEKTTT